MMSDLISRRQAIDVIDKEQKEIDVSDVSAMYAYSKCKTIIKQLPSVLGTNLAEVGTDAISRDAVKELLNNNGLPHHINPILWKELNDLPSARSDKYWKEQCQSYEQTINKLRESLSTQPEIIRCKGCKHRDNYGCCKHWKGLAMGDIPIATDDNDFCSRGERREVTT